MTRMTTAPDNVRSRETNWSFAYYRPVRRNTQQHALLPFVLEQRRPYDIREHDKPLQGGGSLCSGKEDGGWRHVLLYPARTLTGFSRIPICWLTSRICSISGASWWWWRRNDEDFNTVCTLLIAIILMRRKMSLIRTTAAVGDFWSASVGERILFQAQCAQYCYRSWWQRICTDD